MNINTDYLTPILKYKKELQPITIFQIGSSTLPFLNNHRDVDILIYLSPDNLRDSRHLVLALKHKKLILGDVHPVDVENKNGIIVYPYLFHYAKLLWGDPQPEPDFLHNNKLKQCTVKQWLPLLAWNAPRKILYHLYAMLCFWEHDDYILTENEQQKINILHDLARYAELSTFQYLKDELWEKIWNRAKQLGMSIKEIQQILAESVYLKDSTLPDFTKFK